LWIVGDLAEVVEGGINKSEGFMNDFSGTLGNGKERQ